MGQKKVNKVWHKEFQLRNWQYEIFAIQFSDVFKVNIEHRVSVLSNGNLRLEGENKNSKIFTASQL